MFEEIADKRSSDVVDNPVDYHLWSDAAQTVVVATETGFVAED